jgi:fatty acid CoA ligase FadD9
VTTSAPKISRYARRVLDLAAADPQLHELMPDETVLAEVTRNGQTLQGIVHAILTGYSSRPALGTRTYEIGVDGATGLQIRRLQPRFETVTYSELGTRVRAVAAAWQQDPRFRVAPDEFVLFLGFAGTDYVTVDLACVYAHAVAVPLQSTLVAADLERIITDTEPVVIAATMADLELAAQLAGRHPSVRSIVALDHDGRIDDDVEQWTAAAGELARNGSAASLVTLADLIEIGSAHRWEPQPEPDLDEDRIALLIHSSGSTGTPKGAIVTERHARFQFTVMPPTPVPTVRLCFAPLNHFMGRGAVFNTMARGGTAYFTAQPDMSTLVEDFRLVRPTEAVMFPRVFEMVHRHFLGEVARRSASETADVEKIRAEVMAEMRYTYFGDRIASIYAGAAPTTPEIQRFIAECFPVTYAEGYGTTEAGGSVTVRDRINRSEVLDYKLRDVPELGYFSTDRPYPRGELLVKTRLAIPGYYKNAEATAKLFDEDGYVCTGDIMEERGPDHLVYVDRRNDVLKLAQGEFVTLGAVGNAFETHSDVIRQIFVYGNSARAFLLAVVVPDMDVVALRLGPGASDSAIRDLIRAEFAAVAQKADLRSFEVPREFILEREPFSQANGLLSSVSKRLRPRLLDKYGSRLEQLYDNLERKQNDDLLALRGPASGLTVLEKVRRALAVSLAVEEGDVSDTQSFADLGGDSLASAAFGALLNEIFGVELPVNSIVSPAGNAAAWAAEIEAALGGAVRPTAASVHGPTATELHAGDLDIARLLPDDVLAAAGGEVAPADSRVVLVTGVTGFLGRFLCLEWLDRVAQVGGRVVCLVRGRDQVDARGRLRAAFASDDDLAQRFAGHEQRVEVVVGDVAEAHLGLDRATFDRLASEVDRIVHPAALVNHVLEYHLLFGPNVLGTAELVGLALTGQRKRYDFVSSLAVVPCLERSGGIDERSALRESIRLSSHYGAHYGASKWAAEQVLHSAHERCGLPITIFRGDMMLPHRTYRGQVNVPDLFVRLLYSLVTTQAAPVSFYERGPDGRPARAHYDGLPVDFIAEAVVAISSDPETSLETYHVINAHDDGISLDTLVDWIEAAGFPLHRTDDYDQWLATFTAKLEALPPEARQRSSLAVIASLRRPARAGSDLPGSAHFEEGVRRFSVEGRVPRLSAGYVAKCLDDLVHLGLIRKP